MPLNPTKYIAVDPGDRWTGWAQYDEKANLSDLKTFDGHSAVWDRLKLLQGPAEKGEITHLIIEDFRLYPWLSPEQAWSRFDTVKLIGVLEYWASLNTITVIMQAASTKSMAYKWAGISKPSGSNPMRHELDAYVHGVFWLQDNGFRRPQQFRFEKRPI